MSKKNIIDKTDWWDYFDISWRNTNNTHWAIMNKEYSRILKRGNDLLIRPYSLVKNCQKFILLTSL